MISDSTSDLIAWTRSGNSFLIKKQEVFTATVLSVYYKHKNFSSFVRQLNMYGFHKVSNQNGPWNSPEQSEPTIDDSCEFFHPHFKRNHPELLTLIKRKVPKSLIQETNTLNAPLALLSSQPDPTTLRLLREEIQQLKNRQESMSRELKIMHDSVRNLWEEIFRSTDRYQDQQKMIESIAKIFFKATSKDQQPSNKALPLGPTTITRVPYTAGGEPEIPPLQSDDLDFLSEKGFALLQSAEPDALPEEIDSAFSNLINFK